MPSVPITTHLFLIFINCLRRTGKDINSASGASVRRTPFTSCSLPNAFGTSFIDSLEQELGQLKYDQRDNDLYTFTQTKDLKKSKLPAITALRSCIYGQFLDWARELSGIPLNTTVDMFAAKYNRGDVFEP
jgi:hypothetical protein